GLARGRQALDFGAEFVQIFKAAVHRGKAHVGNFIQLAQFRHHAFAEHTAGYFALTAAAQAMFNTGEGAVNVFDTDRAFFQRPQSAGMEFFFVEGLTRAVLLDDARHHQFGGFEGRETLTTADAFASAADLFAIGDQARVDDFGFRVSAERTM